MYKFVTFLQNTKGDALSVGALAVIDRSTSERVAIYSDAGGTPIADNLGVPSTTTKGLVEFYVEDGIYHVDAFKDSAASQFAYRITDFPMVADLSGQVADVSQAVADAQAAAVVSQDKADDADTARAAAVSAQGAAEEAQSAAEAAATSAAASLAAALTAGTVYADAATGRAAVANGAYYWAIGSTAADAFDYWQRVDASNSTLIRSLPSSAALAAAATSYSHLYSATDRTALLSANGASMTGVAPVSGTVSNLFDGGVADNTTDSVNYNGVALTAVYLWQIILPKGVWLICDEWRQKQSGTQSYGNGELEALKPDGTWVTASSNAANGGATIVTRSATAVDDAGYGGFRLKCTSGTGGAGWLREVELKLRNGSLNGTVPLPISTERGKVLTQQTTVGGDALFAEPIDYNAAAVSGAGLMCEYFFNEGAGETIYDRSGNGRHIAFDSAHRATYGGTVGTNYVWTKRGLLLRKAIVQTASLTSTRTVVACYIPLREDGSNVQFNVSNNTAINSNNVRMASGGATQSTQTVHVGHGGEGVVPLYRDTSGTNGYAVSRGGPLLVFSESSAGITGMLGMGGQANVTVDTVRSTEMVCVYFAVYSGTLTGSQRTAVRDALRRSLAVRGIRIDHRDCEVVHAGAFNIGQSNTGNLSISPAGLSAANVTALSFTPNTMILCAGRRDEATPMATPSQYMVGFNSFPGFRALGMGYEAGMALAHEKANATARRKLAICKVGAGSSNVSDATALSWNVAVNPGTGMLGFALKSWRDMEQYFLNRGEGVKLFAVNTQNGEQEANNTGVAASWPASYQANMQGIWDKLKEQLLFTGIKMQVGELFPFDTGQSNYTLAGVDAVRSAQAAFVAANSSDCTLITSAAGLKQSDKLHITADNSVIRGETQFYPGMAIT